MSYLKRTSTGLNDLQWNNNPDIEATLTSLQNQINVLTERLNSTPTLSYQYCAQIPTGADMHSSTYWYPGNFYCNHNNDAATLLNCPTTDAFILHIYHCTQVTNSSGTRFLLHIYRTYRGKVYAQYWDGNWVNCGLIGGTELNTLNGYTTMLNIIGNYA